MSHFPISIELRFLRIPTRWSLIKEDFSGKYELDPEVDQQPERKLKPILEDPRDLRTEFLKLPRTERAALAFLDKIGVWDTWRVTTISSDGYRIGSTVPGQILDGAFGHRYLHDLSVLPLAMEELWAEQDRWKELLDDPTALRKQFSPPPSRDARLSENEAFAIHTKFENTLEIHLEWKKGAPPRAVLQPMTGRELLIATAWLDVAQKANIQVCQRRDCGLSFTGREQKYCSDSCAHLMAVRAFREREKKKKKNPQRRKTRRKRKAREG